MASRAEASEPPGQVRYKRIEEKIRHLTKSNIDQETKEILEILDQGNIIYPGQGPSLMEWLVRKIDDLYQELSYEKLVQTLYPSYKASALAEEEDLGRMVWRQLRFGATDLSEIKGGIYITSDLIARELIAKLKIYTPLGQWLCTRILWQYIYYCSSRMNEWNPNFFDLLTFLTREGGDPFRLLGPEDKPPIITAFTLFLGKLSSNLSQTLMPSVSTFLEEAFKKWEVSISKESILNDVIKYIPDNIVEGDSIHLSSVKGIIVANCLRIIATKPSLCDHEDGEGKTPLHRLMERVLADGLWKMIPDLVRGTDKLWDLMFGLITNKNVNIKDKNGVTPYTWILWWQKSLTDFQTVDSLKRQKLASKIEDVKKHFQEKGASEEDALQGLKKLKITSPYRRIEEKIDNLTKLNVERQAKEILQIIEEGEIIYPTQGPSIMKKLVGKIDELYLEPSFANLIKTLHPSYEASALARKEDLTNMVWWQLRGGATDWSDRKGTIWITSKSIATDVMAKLKIYTHLERWLRTGNLKNYVGNCDIDKEWNSDFVGLLTFLIREGADPFYPLAPGGKPPFETAFKKFLEKFSPHLSDSLMPSVSDFLEEAFKKWETSKTKESILYDVIKNLPSDIVKGESSHHSTIKVLIVRNCLEIIKTNPNLCDHEDIEGKTPLHKLMENILIDGFWKGMPKLVAGTDTLWDLMSGLITNKNVNHKDKDKVTPYTWILWWQNFVTDCQTFDAQEKQTLAKKIEDVKKQFQEKGASEEEALQGLKNLKTTSPYSRIEEKIGNLTKLNVERDAEEILQIIEEGKIIYPTQGPSIMKKLVGKTDELYLEPSFAKLIKTLHPSYKESGLAREEDLTNLVWRQLRGGATDWSESKGKIRITSESIARDVMAKLKIYTPLDRMLSTRIMEAYMAKCDINKEWSTNFVGLLTFLIREGADPFCPLSPGGKPQKKTAFKVFLERFSPHLSDSLMPSVSTFLEEAFKKWETSETKESILYDVIRDLPSDIVKGESSHLSTIKGLIVRNCLEIIKTNPGLCDHEDREGKTPLHKLMENILIDELWKRMPELVAGTDTLWDLMSGLITKKNVNIKDKDKVTPHAWILWWQESVTDYQIFNTKKKQNLVRKIEDIKKQFEENGACEEDALQGLKNFRSKRQSGIFDGFKKLFRKNQGSKDDGHDRTKDQKNTSITTDSKTIATISSQKRTNHSEQASPKDEERDKNVPLGQEDLKKTNFAISMVTPISARGTILEDTECDQHLPITVRPASPQLVKEVLNNPEDCYKMSAEPRGRVIILNNEIFDQSETAEVKLEGRDGSYFDVENLRRLFEALRFEIVVWSNISAEEIKKKIKEESQSEFHEMADAFVFIILSHGKKGQIFGTDGKSVHIDAHIVGAFDGRKCQQLIGKPKLFFIQACQGDQVSEGTMKLDSSAPLRQPSFSPPTDEGPVHEKADVLIFYSTVPGYASWRNTEVGSWFIRDVVICINNYAHKLHVGDIMTKVNKQVSEREVRFQGYKQISEYRSTLTKFLYFLPST